MSTGITKKESIKNFLGKPNVQSFIQEVLGNKSVGFATNLTQVVNQNDLLKNADKPSILNAAITATLLDLNLNPSFGHAYLVPFNTKQQDGSYKTLAQFILGYKGLKQLAIRSGQFKSIDTKKVFEGQLVENDSFVGFTFDWKNKKSETVIGYACRFELLNGFEKILYMTVEEIEAHGEKYSKTYSHKFGQWKTNFEGMAKKTVTKLCLNSGEAPLSIEMQNAIKYDQAAVINPETGEVDYVDSNETEDVEAEEVDDREEFTPEMFEQAKANGADIETIEKAYKVSDEVKQQYLDFDGAKK